MNNLEVFLLYRYFKSYKELPLKTEKILTRLNISLFAIFVLLDIVNIFTCIFFTSVDGVYVRSQTMMLSQGYQFIMLVAIFIVSLLSKKLNTREKVTFSIYCVLPFVAIIIQNIFKCYAIAYASIIIAIEILFAFLSIENNLELTKQEEKIKDAQTKIMLSQIKPHFVYNSLSSISTLIEIDPHKAQSALDDFTEYLRRNLSSLTETRLIPFEDELKHIKTYISLEKMRFGNNHLLPYGPLRESIKEIKRADEIILVNKADENLNDTISWAKKEFNKPIKICNMIVDKIYNIQTKAQILKYEKAIAFCAIGQPIQFYNFAKQFYKIVQTITFADHHKYSKDDIEALLTFAKKYNINTFITTQKDETKLYELIKDIKGYCFNVLSLKSEIKEI